MKPSKLTSIFIIFIVAHLNLVLPVSNASNSSDICIMDNGVYMANHSDNQKIHDHRGSVRQAHDAHHGHHQHMGIHQIKADCNMDMSSSDIYFPGGEHPFTNIESQELDFYSPNLVAFSTARIQIIEGFLTPLYNPPRFIS